MAFAPLEVSFDRGDASIVGCFNEKEYGHLFEYSKFNDGWEPVYEIKGEPVYFPHKVWVTHPSHIDGGYRHALVKKTVAYVVVDETENGFVVEKWDIKNQREYVR